MAALSSHTAPATAAHPASREATSTIHVRPGEGRHSLMIDGDHVAKAAVRDTEGVFEVFDVIAPAKPMAPQHVSPCIVFPAGTPSSFEVLGDSAWFVAITSGNHAGPFFADFASSVPADRPLQESLEAILAVTQRHGVRLAGR